MGKSDVLQRAVMVHQPMTLQKSQPQMRPILPDKQRAAQLSNGLASVSSLQASVALPEKLIKPNVNDYTGE